MNKFGDQLKLKRSELGLKVKDICRITGIDQAIISKVEGNRRLPTSNQIDLLSKAYKIEVRILKKSFLAEKIVKMLEYDTDIASDVMLAAEDRIEYLKSQKAKFSTSKLSDRIQSKLSTLNDLKLKWQHNKPLSGLQLQKLEEYFNVQYTYESNKIEGNTLTLRETELVVNKGITVSGKSMQEHLEAINHVDAAAYLIDLVSKKEQFNERVLRELHSLILRGIDTENAGVYRSVPVGISGSRHIPPQPYLLDKLMEDYFKYYTESHKVLHPIVLAAEMHERLVSIHPFIDGNGRTARLVMNLILLQHGYPIAILKGDADKRLAYYEALEAVQIDNNVDYFYDLVIDEVYQSLESHLSMVVIN